MHEPEAKYWLFFFSHKYDLEDISNFYLNYESFSNFTLLLFKPGYTKKRDNIQSTDFHTNVSWRLLIWFAQVTGKWIACPNC